MDWDGAEVAAAYNCCWSERKKERRERRGDKSGHTQNESRSAAVKEVASG